MKKINLSLFLLLSGIVYSQTKAEIHTGISNQGQFDKIVEDFYFVAHPTGYQDDAHKGSDIRIKYNLIATYIFKDSLEIRMRFGYASRKNHYEQTFPNTSWIVDDKQNIFELTPSFGFRKNLGRFSFSTGIEIPIFIVGKLSEHIDYREYSNSINLSYAGFSQVTMNGGFIVGVNHYMNIKTFLNKDLFLFSEFNYGILYAQLGRKYQNTSGQTYPTETANQFDVDKTYSKFYFSSIQAQIGLGFNF